MKSINMLHYSVHKIKKVSESEKFPADQQVSHFDEVLFRFEVLFWRAVSSWLVTETCDIAEMMSQLSAVQQTESQQ